MIVPEEAAAPFPARITQPTSLSLTLPNEEEIGKTQLKASGRDSVSSHQAVFGIEM